MHLTPKQKAAIAGLVVALAEIAAEFFVDYAGPIRAVSRLFSGLL